MCENSRYNKCESWHINVQWKNGVHENDREILMLACVLYTIRIPQSFVRR